MKEITDCHKDRLRAISCELRKMNQHYLLQMADIDSLTGDTRFSCAFVSLNLEKAITEIDMGIEHIEVFIDPKYKKELNSITS